jgi:hypothetical protein
MAPPASGTQIPFKNHPTEIRPAGKEAEAMDSAAAPAMAIATPATDTTGKKQGKPKKATNDMTEEERRMESSKRAGQREGAKTRKAAAKLEEERVRTNDRIIA